MTRSQPFVEYRTATNERKEDFHESKEKLCQPFENNLCYGLFMHWNTVCLG